MELDSRHRVVWGFSCPHSSPCPPASPRGNSWPHFLTCSDFWTHSATESLVGRDLGIWHSGRIPWMCCVFSLSASLCCHRSSTRNILLCTWIDVTPFSWLIPAHLLLSKLAQPLGGLLWSYQMLGLRLSPVLIPPTEFTLQCSCLISCPSLLLSRWQSWRSWTA